MIEVILGVNIILSMFIIVALLIGSNKASHIKRIKIEEGNRIIYCVMQEIKYNMTINELIGKENIISFSLKYNEKFLENLIKFLSINNLKWQNAKRHIRGNYI